MWLPVEEVLLKVQFATIFTPQGDGNIRIQRTFRHIVIKICHDIYPARGRKQVGYNPETKEFISICHDIYPARGRKPMQVLSCCLTLLDLPRYLPRKGTETCQ